MHGTRYNYDGACRHAMINVRCAHFGGPHVARIPRSVSLSVCGTCAVAEVSSDNWLHAGLGGAPLPRLLERVNEVARCARLVDRLHRPPLVLAPDAREAYVRDECVVGAVVVVDQQPEARHVLEARELRRVLDDAEVVLLQRPFLHGGARLRIRKVERLMVDVRLQRARRHPIAAADDS